MKSTDDLVTKFNLNFLQAFSYWKCLVYSQGKFKKEDLIKALEEITFEDIIIFSKELFNKVKFEWFFGGNIRKEDC